MLNHKLVIKRTALILWLCGPRAFLVVGLLYVPYVSPADESACVFTRSVKCAVAFGQCHLAPGEQEDYILCL